jgi:hypothetical protein
VKTTTEGFTWLFLFVGHRLQWLLFCPELIPGRPSHGCVRVPNRAIKRLAKLMPIGTPVRIV